MDPVTRAISNFIEAGDEKEAIDLIDRIPDDEYLGQKLRMLNTPNQETGDTLLFQAIRKNQPDVVLKLISAGVSLKPIHENNVTPLMLAAGLGHEEIVMVLFCQFEVHQSKHALDKNGFSALMHAENYAKQASDRNMVNLLLGGNSDVLDEWEVVEPAANEAKEDPPAKALQNDAQNHAIKSPAKPKADKENFQAKSPSAKSKTSCLRAGKFGRLSSGPSVPLQPAAVFGSTEPGSEAAVEMTL